MAEILKLQETVYDYPPKKDSLELFTEFSYKNQEIASFDANKKPEVGASGLNGISYDTDALSSPIVAEPIFSYKADANMSSNFTEDTENQNQRFIKFKPSGTVLWLIENYPLAHVLLTIIAIRARRVSNLPDELEIGECFIGDWKAYGLTRQQYRTALNHLIRLKIVKITQTNRTRKKSTTASTTVSTKVKLLDSSIWDINPEDANHSTNHRSTTDQPLTNHKEERIRKNKKEKEEIEDSLRSSSCSESKIDPRKKSSIKFSFEEKCFLNITPKDIELWKGAFPSIKFDVCLKEAENWVLDNPSKAKIQWRRFLTNWFRKAENDAYYRNSRGAQLAQAPQDGKQWEAENRAQFFKWKQASVALLYHMEYEKGEITNTRNGKKMHCRMEPKEFEKTFVQVSGI